jgi:hypothetical protein
MFELTPIDYYHFKANDNDFNIDENTTYIKKHTIKIISEFYLNTGLWFIVVKFIILLTRSKYNTS